MTYDLAVIGGGLAGLVAATAAARGGLKVIVIRRGLGTTAMSSGGLDWAEAAAPTAPEVGAFNTFRDWLAEAGAPLVGEPGAEIPLMDIFGNVRHTHLTFTRFAAGRVDRWPGPGAGGKVLFLGIEGYSPYRPEWVVKTAVSAGLLGQDDAVASRVTVPGLEGVSNLPAARIARVLDDPAAATRFAASVAAAAAKAGAGLVALPPVLGLEEAGTVYEAVDAAVREIRGGTGKAGSQEQVAFELLSPPPSVPGRRLQGFLDKLARAAGVEIASGRVKGAEDCPPRLTGLSVVSGGREWRVEAAEFILATGKFAAGGLIAERQVLSEAVFGLTVHAPPPPGWPPGMMPAGSRPVRKMVWPRLRARHPVFEAGLVVDADLRPLDSGGQPAFANLRAAGSVIGGYNHLTDGVGSGAAVATGVRAGRLAAAALRAAGETGSAASGVPVASASEGRGQR